MGHVTERVIRKGQKLFVMGNAVPWYEIKDGVLRNIILIKKGDDFFYISNKRESEVQEYMRNEAVLNLAGGIIMIVGGTAFLLSKINLL